MPSRFGNETGEYPIPARHALRDQEALWAQLVQLSAAVETALDMSIEALTEGQGNLAATVKDQERMIDRWEVRIEQECLRILSLYDLTASDLRRMVTVLKVNHDLDRIADLAVGIARKARKLTAGGAPVPIPEPLSTLTGEVQRAVRASLDALVGGDSAIALEVITTNQHISASGRAIEKQLRQEIGRHPEHSRACLRLMTVTRNLRRIVQHARNIGACAIYMKEAKIIRHGDGLSPS